MAVVLMRCLRRIRYECAACGYKAPHSNTPASGFEYIRAHIEVVHNLRTDHDSGKDLIDEILFKQINWKTLVGSRRTK